MQSVAAWDGPCPSSFGFRLKTRPEKNTSSRSLWGVGSRILWAVGHLGFWQLTEIVVMEWPESLEYPLVIIGSDYLSG